MLLLTLYIYMYIYFVILLDVLSLHLRTIRAIVENCDSQNLRETHAGDTGIRHLSINPRIAPG